MTEIAIDFSELYGYTVTTLRRNNVRAANIKRALENLDKVLHEPKVLNLYSTSPSPSLSSKSNDPDLSRLDLERSRDALNSLKGDFSGQFSEFDFWAPMISLAEKWNGRRKFFTPDFNLLFGDELYEEWQSVSLAAYEVFDEKFDAFLSTRQSVEEKVKAFADRGATFQEHLQQKIERERALLK